MELEYTLAEDDFVAFSEHHGNHSPSIRRGRMFQRFGTPSILMVMGLYLFLREPDFLVALIFFPSLLVIVVIWIVRYPSGMRTTYRRQIIKIYREGSNRALLGAQRLRADQSIITGVKMEGSQSKNRQEVQNQINKWNAFSDSTLVSEIKRLSDSGNHWEFVKSTYPMIRDSKLKERINALLLDVAKRLPVEKEAYEFSAKVIYICAKLHLPQSAEVILKVIKDIGEPSNIHDPSVLPYLNDAIKELKLPEATEFLSKQLDALAGIKRSDHERYWKYASALFALEVIDVERSKLYRDKLDLHPAYKPVSEWSRLRDDELKIEIRKNIQGVGGWEAERYLSFIPECYKKLDDNEFRQRVDKILVELMSEVAYGVGERAIYVGSNLPLANIRERILEIIHKTDRMFEIINNSPVVEDWSTYIGYIRELDDAVRRLNLVEAKGFLDKQLGPLKKTVPEPVTKEYYLYHLAQTALDALKKIDPELTKKYL